MYLHCTYIPVILIESLPAEVWYQLTLALVRIKSKGQRPTWLLALNSLCSKKPPLELGAISEVITHAIYHYSIFNTGIDLNKCESPQKQLKWIIFLNKQPKQNPMRELINLKVRKVWFSLPVASHVATWLKSGRILKVRKTHTLTHIQRSRRRRRRWKTRWWESESTFCSFLPSVHYKKAGWEIVKRLLASVWSSGTLQKLLKREVNEHWSTRTDTHTHTDPTAAEVKF